MLGPVRDPFRPNRSTVPDLASATRSRRTLPLVGYGAAPVFVPTGDAPYFRERPRVTKANWSGIKAAQQFDGDRAVRDVQPVDDNAFTRYTRQIVTALSGVRPGIETRPQRGQ